MANLTVAMRWANRLKGNQTPYEAFASNAHAQNGIRWETVSRLAAQLPKNKSWRFECDAMDRFEGENDFIARQLTDNAYIARAAVRYLGCLKGVGQIVPSRGGLTALLRGKWGLNGILSDSNRKTREDHRHHAIDAAVVALADRSVLKSVSDQTARGADGRVRIIVPELSENIARAVQERVLEIIVAFKPDHGWQGAMFKDSAYGFVKPERRDMGMSKHNLVVRKPLRELTLEQCKWIRDKQIRGEVEEHLQKSQESGKDLTKASVRKTVLAAFAEERGVRSVRILATDQTVKPVVSAPYKGYAVGLYVCCDVWRCPKGERGAWRNGEYEWHGKYWPYAKTVQGVPRPETGKPHPAAKLVARLFKDDMIAFEDGGRTQVMRVAGFSTTNNKLDVVPHCAADSPQKFVSINVLGSKGLRKIQVSPDGLVRGLKR